MFGKVSDTAGKVDVVAARQGVVRGVGVDHRSASTPALPSYDIH